MKNGIFRLLSAFCALAVTLSCLTFSAVSADEPEGRMSSVYAYVFNDYLYTYGVMETAEAGDTLRDEGDGGYAPRGVVYGDIVNFDANDNPYLVIFLAASEYNTASCHIWRYDEETEKAERIAILDVNHSILPEGDVGVFSLGSTDNKRFITYKVYKNDEVVVENCYTAVNGVAYKYLKTPEVENESGVMDFSHTYFHSGVDISNGNKTANDFFDKLKNTAANSVSYEDISGRIAEEDEAQLEKTLKKAVNIGNFDIADYSSDEAYEKALDSEQSGGKFYLVSEAYNLGDEIYYVCFSTDRSYYNYALLRRSDEAENGYQILNVKTDCIPLSDTELKKLKADYVRNTLLYKKTKNSIKLYKESETDGKKGNNIFNLPSIQIEKILNSKTRLPAVCIGGGVAIALLTILWVYLYSDND